MRRTDKGLYIGKFETVLKISNTFKFKSDDFNKGIKRLLKKDKSIIVKETSEKKYHFEIDQEMIKTFSIQDEFKLQRTIKDLIIKDHHHIVYTSSEIQNLNIIYDSKTKKPFTGTRIREDRETAYKNGKLDGRDIFYLSSSKKIDRYIEYKNNLQHGVERDFGMNQVFGGMGHNYPDNVFMYPYKEDVISETNWKNGKKHGLSYHHGIGGTESYPYRRYYKNGSIDGISDSIYMDLRTQHIWKNKKLIEIRYFLDGFSCKLDNKNTDYDDFKGVYEGRTFITTYKKGKDYFKHNKETGILEKI